MNFHFPAPPAGAHSVVRLEKVSKHYGSVSVFENVDFEIVKGDRIAIVGVNGAGKSTFSRLISGGEAPSSGSVTMGRHTQVAFSPRRMLMTWIRIKRFWNAWKLPPRGNLRPWSGICLAVSCSGGMTCTSALACFPEASVPVWRWCACCCIRPIS